MTDLNQARLKELLEYAPDTGDLFWLPRPLDAFPSLNAWAAWNARYSGAKAGTILSNGYLALKLNGLPRKAHRIIWCLFHGECAAYPECEIDHINGNKLDNRITNLRRVSHSENCRNRKKYKSNSSGVMGVSWNRFTQKWTAYIGQGGKNHLLGGFNTFEEACTARSTAERDLGYHVNHGREAA